MSTVRRTWPADAAVLLTCTMIVAAILLERATPERLSVEPTWGSNGSLGAVVLLLPGVAFVAVGWLIA